MNKRIINQFTNIINKSKLNYFITPIEKDRALKYIKLLLSKDISGFTIYFTLKENYTTHIQDFYYEFQLLENNVLMIKLIVENIFTYNIIYQIENKSFSEDIKGLTTITPSEIISEINFEYDKNEIKIFNKIVDELSKKGNKDIEKIVQNNKIETKEDFENIIQLISLIKY